MPIVITGPAAIPGVPQTRRSLQTLRRHVARALHSLTVCGTTAVGNASGTSIVSTTLANAVSSNRYKHAWVMPVSGTHVQVLRRVRAEDALNLTTGELMVAPAFSAQVASGVGVEIHRLLPPDDDDGWTGLRTLINDALRECWFPMRLPITGVDGQPAYDLAAYEEWLDPEAVLELRGQAATSSLNPFAAGQFGAVRNADSLTVQVHPTLATGDTATAEVFRAADTWIRTAGVWADSTTGLQNEDDETILNPDLVVSVALAHAYAALASGPDGSRYEDLARKQRMRANGAKLLSLSHKQRQPNSRLTTAGQWGWASKDYPLGMGW